MKKLIILLSITILLTACGFQPRSTRSLPEQLQNNYYQPSNPYGELELNLKRSLSSYGIVFAKNANTAKTIFNLSSNFTSNANSPATSSQASTYTVTYTATFNIISNKGKVLLPLQTVSTSRTLVLAPGEVFEVSPQVETNKHEMQQELIVKIVNILSSKQAIITLSN